MLSDVIKPVMPSVALPSVILLSVAAPHRYYPRPENNEKPPLYKLRLVEIKTNKGMSTSSISQHVYDGC